MTFAKSPDRVYHASEKVMIAYATGSGIMNETLDPKGPFKLKEVRFTVDAGGTTSENFTINLDANEEAAYDSNVRTKDLSGVVDWDEKFDRDYDDGDKLDFDWPNTETGTWALTVIYRRN